MAISEGKKTVSSMMLAQRNALVRVKNSLIAQNLVGTPDYADVETALKISLILGEAGDRVLNND